MPPFELNTISDLFWRSSSTKEEKTPILKNNPKVPDGGSIPKESKMNGTLDSKSTYDSLVGSEANSVEEDPNEPPKMTLLRKLCFLLSLNGGVVYVAALLWLIPCRHPLCMAMTNWTANISGQLTTDMEIQSAFLSSSVLFGMANENGAQLTSLALENGTVDWNVTTDNILKNVFCDLEYLNDGNKTVPYCIVTAYNYISAYNAANGALLWERNITDPTNVIIHHVVSARKPFLEPIILVVSDEQLFVLSAKSGTLLSKNDLPCSWTVGVKLVGPWATSTETSWTLVCEYGDSLEVWNFLEEEVLSLKEDGEEGPFRLLFSRQSGSIDLTSDVTSTPHSLALSWADSVVMVTNQAPHHRLRKSWERRFGDNSTVTSIASGRFTNSKEHQIAVTVQDGSNTTLHILERLNGTSEFSTQLGMRSVMSMHSIASGERDVNTLVMESISPNENKNNVSYFISKPTRREYFTLKYAKGKVVREHILTTEASASIFNQFTEGAANLLIASQNPVSSTTISRYVLISKREDQCG